MSAVPLPELCAVVFDLDDTLYPEREFVRSGFRAVSNAIERETGKCVFDRLIELFEYQHPDPFDEVRQQFRLSIPKQALVDMYRNHLPDLALTAEVSGLLAELKSSGRVLGLLTDGRSRTQRSKIRALGLEAWTDAILISEEFGTAKPAERNYRYFEVYFAGRPCVYVGDNPAKDFAAPNRMGWQTVCVLDRGENVHAQIAANVHAEALPQYWIERLA